MLLLIFVFLKFLFKFLICLIFRFSCLQGSKKLASNNATERYRLLVSDGKYHNSFAMVATQLNEMVSSGQLSEFTIVKINRYITSIFNTSDKER